MLLLSCILFLFSNCTIQKRTYKKGYFVQWNFNKKFQSSEDISKSIEKTSEKIDTIHTYTFENELSLNTKTSTNSIKSGEQDFIELEKNNLGIPEQKEIKIQLSSKTGEVKKHKSLEKIEKEEKVEDDGIRFHRTFTTALATLLFGIILCIHGLSANYINWTLGLGIPMVLVGVIVLLISFALLSNWLKSKKKNKEPSERIKKKYTIFGIIEALIITSFITLLYLAKQLL
ncbi:MAG: hypothetical protein V4622_01095 [Bacteroidota bacterium]